MRAIYRETNFGPQLEIRKIRPVCEADAADGFSPLLCLPQTRFDREEMFAELLSIAQERIDDAALRNLTVALLDDPSRGAADAAGRHAQPSCLCRRLAGTRAERHAHGVYLADKYDDYYPDMQPRLDRGLVVAGGILHDIGKLREIEERPQGAEYTAAGNLIGHILQGRDIVREAAATLPARSRDAAAARAHHRRPPAAARMGIAQAADDARSPAGPLRRRHRREISDDCERAILEKPQNPARF